MGNKVKTARELREVRTPETDDKYVGVEIEFFAPIEEDACEVKLLALPLSDYVCLTWDGSIKPGRADSCDCCCEGCHDESSCIYEWDSSKEFSAFELCVLCKESEVDQVMAQVGDFLKSIHAQVNDTCGLHVHLDMRTRNVVKSYAKLYKAQNVLYRMCPIKRKTGKYSKPSGYATFESQQTSETRYVGINAKSFSKHTTLEVRMHHGSVDAKEITSWIKFLLRVVNGAEIAKPVNTPLKLLGRNATKELISFANGRIKRYSKQHRKAG